MKQGMMAGIALAVLTVAGLIGRPAPLLAEKGADKARIMQARITLGRRLFYDADLSRDGTMACATCHEQHHGFADGNRNHPGVTGEAGRRNVPGLANVAQFKRLTWADPRQTTLEKQAAVPVFGTHPVEMGMAGMAAEIPKRLGRDPCYGAMFAAAFPHDHGRITFTAIARALAGFERQFRSYASPYDRGALSVEAKAGQALFRKDCAACHSGANFTDLAYHRLEPIAAKAPDQGLFEITARTGDRGKFRTASLRNVAVTAPYWHDGSAPTLAEAIARHRLAHSPSSPVELAQIEAFLASLTDQDFLTRPALGLPTEACGKPL